MNSAPTPPTPQMPPPPANPPTYGSQAPKKKGGDNQGFTSTVLGAVGSQQTAQKTLLGQ